MQLAHMVLPSTCRLTLLRQPLQSKNQIKSPMQERIIGSASGGGGCCLLWCDRSCGLHRRTFSVPSTYVYIMSSATGVWDRPGVTVLISGH